VAGRRLNVLWISVGTLVILIGVLAVANALKFDVEKVKAEIDARLAEYRQIPEDDVLGWDALHHDLLANDSYKEHAKRQYGEVERLHPRIHDAAQLEREALKAVPPFLARCKDLSKLSGDELRRLHDETRSHLSNYGTTRQAAPLRETLTRLKEQLEKQDKVGPQDLLVLQKSVHDLCKAGRFAEAKERIDAFRRRIGSGDYPTQVRELEEMVRRKAAAVTPR
jgi:hypothetical protein